MALVMTLPLADLTHPFMKRMENSTPTNPDRKQSSSNLFEYKFGNYLESNYYYKFC
jgi:hypothetical protein